jgi:hypothetical protein
MKPLENIKLIYSGNSNADSVAAFNIVQGKMTLRHNYTLVLESLEVISVTLEVRLNNQTHHLKKDDQVPLLLAEKRHFKSTLTAKLINIFRANYYPLINYSIKILAVMLG